MADGYLVSLGGDGILDTGDAIGGTLTTFDIQTTIGSGTWRWSGVYSVNGQFYSNINDTGVYDYGTDGNVYFIPDNYVITSGSASATSAPTFDPAAYTPDGTVDGTSDGGVIDGSVPGDPDADGGGADDDDLIYAYGGRDLIHGGAGMPSFSAATARTRSAAARETAR